MIYLHPRIYGGAGGCAEFPSDNSFILCFLDDDTYRVIQDEIYNNQDKIIVVAGKWEKSEI